MRYGFKADGIQLQLKFMTLATCQILMLAIQRERCQTVMIKFWNLPVMSRMTILTNFILELLRMDITMAFITTVVSVLVLGNFYIAFVTGRTIQVFVFPGEREEGRVMIEG